MERILYFILVVSSLWLAYTFVGYPLGIRAVARWVKKKKPCASAEPEGFVYPDVALVISAFNEEAVIEKKLRNALSLDYPKDRLSIWVSSDGSTDRTNTIVERYARTYPNVNLVAHPQNRGKTRALLDTLGEVPERFGVIVFSDANSIYHPDAVKNLVRHFRDRRVGCVAGELRYRARASERRYRRYENAIKEAQSRLGIPVAAEGSIFAVRRHLIPNLDASTLEDLVIPLRVAARGYAVVYEPQAVSEEEFELGLLGQWTRRFRIVNRAARALGSLREYANPFRGRYAYHFFSHRVMRWWSPFAVVGLLVALAGLWLLDDAFSGLAGLLLGGFVVCSSFGLLLEAAGRGPRPLRLVGAFVWHSSAIMAGVISAWLGLRFVRWTPRR